MENREKTQKGGYGLLTEAGISYSLAAILPMILSVVILLIALPLAGEGYAKTDWFKYISFLLPQLCFAAVVFLFIRRSRTSPRQLYCGCKWYYFPIALVLQFGLLFSLNELNDYFIAFLGLFGYQPSFSDSIPTLSGWNLLPAILVIAVLPAFLEETVFRGILSGSMQRSGWGTAATVLIAGALFSLFHGNPEQTLYQFVCGMCFTLLSLRAGSIFPGMVAHFLNNAVILILSAAGLDDLHAALSTGGYVALCVVSGVCLLATLAFLLFDSKKNVKGGVKEGKKFFLAAVFGIVVCAVEWITALIGGIV